MNIDRIEWHLQNWAYWMRRVDNFLGYPAKSSGFLCCCSGRGDFDEMVAKEDDKCAVNIDVIIDGLDRRGKEIINHRYLGVAVSVMYDDEELYCLFDKISAIAEKRNLI